MNLSSVHKVVLRYTREYEQWGVSRNKHHIQGISSLVGVLLFFIIITTTSTYI